MKMIGTKSAGLRLLQAACLTMLAGLALGAAHGQAVPTATRSLGISVFGGATLMKPDYTTQNDYGFVLGGDVWRNFRLVTVGIEPKFGRSSGDFVTQTYFVANLRFERALGRRAQFHPFFGAGIGTGTMHLGAPIETSQTSSPTYDIFGGLDYDLKAHFGVRGEYQYQFWDFGVNSNGLNPSGADVAIYYRIGDLHFRRRH